MTPDQLEHIKKIDEFVNDLTSHGLQGLLEYGVGKDSDAVDLERLFIAWAMEWLTENAAWYRIEPGGLGRLEMTLLPTETSTKKRRYHGSIIGSLLWAVETVQKKQCPSERKGRRITDC